MTADLLMPDDDPMVERFLTIKDIGRALGVADNTAAGWLSKYDDWPAHDIEIGTLHTVRAWRADRLDEWRTWMESRPGRGAGGGRPRGSTSKSKAGKPASATGAGLAAKDAQ